MITNSPTVTFVYTGSTIKLSRDNVHGLKMLSVEEMNMRRSASDMEGKKHPFLKTPPSASNQSKSR